jgi:hypothetical protein
MLASYDWRVRHAGLMAIAAIGEGTGKVALFRWPCMTCLYLKCLQVMQNELGKIVEYVMSSLSSYSSIAGLGYAYVQSCYSHVRRFAPEG